VGAACIRGLVTGGFVVVWVFVFVGYLGAGVRFCGFCFDAVRSLCWVLSFVLDCLAVFYFSLFISLAITKSTCLFIIVCSSSNVVISSSYSCSGSFVAGSFPFFDYCGMPIFAVRVSVLGPGWRELLVGWCLVAGVMSVVVYPFLSYAMSTCSSMTAWTIFVGFKVSGSNLAMLSILAFRTCIVSSTLF
jgi:hypothetical protein